MDVLQPLIAAAEGRRASVPNGAERAGLDEALSAAREALDGAADAPTAVEPGARPALSAQPSETPEPAEMDT